MTHPQRPCFLEGKGFSLAHSSYPPLQKEVITTRWANEDPNPTTIMAVKRSHMDLFEKVGHALSTECMQRCNLGLVP